jgi:hypothetical protein
MGFPPSLHGQCVASSERQFSDRDPAEGRLAQSVDWLSEPVRVE